MASQNSHDLFDQVADGLLVCDPETHVIEDVNQSALEMLEYEREELVGERVGAVSEPSNPAGNWEEAIARARGNESRQFEVRLVPKRGEQFPAEAHLGVAQLGETSRAIASIRPIRRARSSGVLGVTEQMRQVIDLLPDPLFVKDIEGTFLLANEAFGEVYGMTPAEIEGKTEFDVEPDRAERFLKKDRELIEEGRSELVYQNAFRTADGTTRYHQTIKIPFERPRGNQAAILGYVRDVTELKQYESELEEQYERLHALFANSQAAIVEYAYRDGEPVVEAVNDRFEEWFGYDEEAATGRSIDALIVPPGDRDQAATLNERVRRGEHLHTEVQRQTTDGLRTFIVRNAPIDTEDEIRGYASYTDITDRKQREQRLEATKQKLDEFASVVSHDLRNPLNVAQTRLELAREDADSEHLDGVERAHERMEALIEDVLTLAREGTTVEQSEWVSLHEIVETCWDSVDTAGARLTVRTDREVRADRSRLQRLLENLVGNSVEHGSPDGDVTITVGDFEDGFYVADDGPGIPEGEREQVFEKGYSTSTDGTGFGLAIVAEIADAHGWTVDVMESENGGARFDISGVDVRTER